MKEILVTIEGRAPYSQSRPHKTEKLDREQHDDFEKRTWRERLHCDAAGNVIIPTMAFKNCLSEAAKFLSMQIPGKGKATYTKHFEAGVLCLEPLRLDITRDQAEGEWLFLPSDGRRGGGKRVYKCYPVIHQWGGTVPFIILDEIITEPVFRAHIEAAGRFIGIGRFRPRNNGFYGRFAVTSIDWPS